MSPLVTLTLPGRVAVKKNGQRIVGSGRNKRRILSPQYRDWESKAEFAMRQAQRGPSLVEHPVRAVFRFYFKNHEHECDCSNVVEGPQDLLVKLGVLKDDRLIYRLEVEKFFGAEPRCEIELFKYEARP